MGEYKMEKKVEGGRLRLRIMIDGKWGEWKELDRAQWYARPLGASLNLPGSMGIRLPTIHELELSRLEGDGLYDELETVWKALALGGMAFDGMN